MNEMRYSFQVAGQYLHMTHGCVQYRAKKLGIDTKNGLTVHDIKLIGEFVGVGRGRRRKAGTIQDLKREMEEMNHE